MAGQGTGSVGYKSGGDKGVCGCGWGAEWGEARRAVCSLCHLGALYLTGKGE